MGYLIVFWEMVDYRSVWSLTALFIVPEHLLVFHSKRVVPYNMYFKPMEHVMEKKTSTGDLVRCVGKVTLMHWSVFA